MEIKRIASDQIRKIESDKIRKVKEESSSLISKSADSLHLSDAAKTYSEAVAYAKNIEQSSRTDSKKVEEVKRRVEEGYYSKNPEVLDEVIRSLVNDL